MYVMVEPKLKNTGSSEFTAYDETNEFQHLSLILGTVNNYLYTTSK